MLASLTLTYLAVSSTLVVLATSPSVTDPTKVLPSDDTIVVAPPSVSIGGVEGLPTEEQHSSPPSVETTLTGASPLVPKVQRKIPKTPRQAMLFEVLGDDLILPFPHQGVTPVAVTSQDMTRLVVGTNLTGTQLFDIDPDTVLSEDQRARPIRPNVIAVSNNGKFMVRVEEHLVGETGENQSMKLETEFLTKLYADKTVRIQGNFFQREGIMEASFSPNSAWVLIRSPLGTLNLWEAVETVSEDQPGQTFEISLEASAAAIGDGIFAYTKGGYLYVHILDTGRTTLLQTSLKNFGKVNKMVICGDRIGMIQGKYFSSYNLDGTMHSRDYLVDVDGSDVTSFAFHDTHLALISTSEGCLYVYDLNEPSKENRTEEALANIVLDKHRRFVSVKDFDSSSFEALEYIFGGAQLYFRKHRIILKPIGDESNISMTSLLPSVMWSIVESYLPKPQVLHQLTGTLPNNFEATAPPKIPVAMNKLIARKFGKIPPVLAVNNHIAYLVINNPIGPKDVTPQLVHFDSRTNISRGITGIPDGITVSNIHLSQDGNRLVLFANNGAIYLRSSKENIFDKLTIFNHNSTTRVLLHPFQPLTFIYHEDFLYLIGDLSKPPKKVELFPNEARRFRKHVATTLAYFSSTCELFVKKTYLHRLTYINVLPES